MSDPEDQEFKIPGGIFGDKSFQGFIDQDEEDEEEDALLMANSSFIAPNPSSSTTSSSTSSSSSSSSSTSASTSLASSSSLPSSTSTSLPSTSSSLLSSVNRSDFFRSILSRTLAMTPAASLPPPNPHTFSFAQSQIIGGEREGRGGGERGGGGGGGGGGSGGDFIEEDDEILDDAGSDEDDDVILSVPAAAGLSFGSYLDGSIEDDEEEDLVFPHEFGREGEHGDLGGIRGEIPPNIEDLLALPVVEEDDDDDEIEEEEEPEEEEEEEEENEPEEVDLRLTKEIGNLGKWSVSSAKQGYGVDKLLDGKIETYWQSDGVGPHSVNIQFPKRVTIQEIRVYVNFLMDESYTCNKFSLRAGTNFHDLQEVALAELTETPRPPQGWQVFKLSTPSGRPLRVHLVQMVVLGNFHSGRDTHVRLIKIYSPRTTSSDPFDPPYSSVDFSMYSTIR